MIATHPQAVELLCDAYLARASMLMRAMKPQAVLFLGDLMDGGNKVSDTENARSLQRLERALSPPAAAAVVHVAGNHDTGVLHQHASSPAFSPYSINLICACHTGLQLIRALAC